MPILQRLFQSADYLAAPLTLANAFAAIVILFAGTIILVRGRASRASTLFFAVTLATTGWLACFALMYASRDASIALTWARIGHLFASLIPAALFHFASEYVGRRRTFRAATILFWVTCAGVGVLSVATS
ncbi:MAG TPA: histidine kinase N-terminal 7TM domain-containing protein, partial [Thermoanaerobaculia bacterium]|nr:histidine kinase N-terminal 7TM domain-containing protein [Thermoanaerobaculia bacterium]